MIKRAGGVDVLATSGEHSKVMTMDAVAAAAPEVVLVAPCGYGVERAAEEARRLVASSDWNLPDDCAVWALDGNALTSRPGPRLVDGIEVMARIFNPALFTPIDDTYALRISSSSKGGPPRSPAAPRTPASATTR
jgi:iron complex transport system substrate-binding protein